MKNEHAGSECPSCAAWGAQLQAVEDALREVGAPVAIPGQEGTLLPPDRIRQMAMAYRTSADRLEDRIRWAEIVLNAVGQVCQIQSTAPTSEDEAVDYARKLHAVVDDARSRSVFRDSVRTCLNEAGVPTGDGGFPHSLERRLSMLVQERDRLRGEVARAEEELRAISAALEGSDGPDTDPAASRAGRVAALVNRLERDRNSSSVARSTLRGLQDELVATRARADFALTVIRVLAGKDDPSHA